LPIIDGIAAGLSGFPSKFPRVRKEAIESGRYAMLRALAQDEAFGEVPAGVLQALVDEASVVDAGKGDIVYDTGEHWSRLGFVVDGCIAMIAQGDDAKEHLYEHTYAGQFFGVSAMFDGGPEMARTLVVSSKARYVTIDREAVLLLCKKHGVLAIAFAMTLARRVRRTTALLADQVNLSAQQRIARYLMTFSDGDAMAPARDPLPLMTQAQIGAAAGTVKDVAARTIGLFEKEGALKRERGNIMWLDRTRLRDLGGL
jgi:CRP/FNR family cyclic AMP-dependent transcriptional regulator